jgi:predicted aspartyl protease
VGYDKNVAQIGPSSIGSKEKTTNSAYPDFITASRNLDIPYLTKTAANDDQFKYAHALELLFNRQSDAAEGVLLDIVSNSTDAAIRNESRLLLETLYLAEGKWSQVLAIHPKPENKTDIYYSHSKAWNSSPPTEYLFPHQAVKVPLRFMGSGQPLVEVVIQGKSYWFVLDSGAQFSVISKKVAEASAVHAIQVEGIDPKATFSNPGVVATMEIDRGVIKNVPVMIMDSRNLEVSGLFTRATIQGIIGWPQLKNLRLEFEPIQHTVRISQSDRRTTEDSNFFFYFRPLVKVSATNGISLFLWCDTGSGNTALFPRGASKIGIEPTTKGFTGTSTIKPMGGTTIERTRVLKQAGFSIGGYFVRFNEMLVEKAASPFFDGRMGMDICASNTLVIDYPKGYVQIQPP